MFMDWLVKRKKIKKAQRPFIRVMHYQEVFLLSESWYASFTRYAPDVRRALARIIIMDRLTQFKKIEIPIEPLMRDQRFCDPFQNVTVLINS